MTLADAAAWPAQRRFAWYALFAAMMVWAAVLDPAPGYYTDPLPFTGELPV